MLSSMQSKLQGHQCPRNVLSRPVACPRVVLYPQPAPHGGDASLLLQDSQQSARRLIMPSAALMDAPAAAAPASSFASIMDSEGDDSDVEVVEVDAGLQDESLKVENLGLSDETVAALQKRGIMSLFPIQKSVFQPIQEGRDLIGRAKTGSGKTLAFALPVIEALLKDDLATGARKKRGRTPRCVVLAPTRELANQVAREFESACPNLKVASVYGGVPIGGHIRELERGVDVVVGTPGRVIDLIERDSLKLDKVGYAILDEADQMLDMGFEEDMEKILSYVPEERQTLLFSATLPKWVNKVARRYQRNPILVDLVGEENTGRLADTIKLQVMQVDWSQKLNAALDCITTHAASGKTIIFVNTKLKADEVCDAVGKTHATAALHGDISQAMRDRALQQFRDGTFQVLVATDVAARGLDIPAVDLVIHYDVPQDNEAFLHRSGRTGRAGRTGTAVVLFTDKEVRTLGTILHQTKVENAELVGAPEPREVLTSAAKSVLGQLDKVEPGVIDFFIPAAEKLLSSDQPSRVLAAALAALGGFRAAPKPRSLLTYEEDMMTLRLMGKAGDIDGFRSLMLALKAIATKAKVKKDFEHTLGKIKVLTDRATRQSGAAFDLPAHEAESFFNDENILAAAKKMGYTLDRPTALPLDLREMMSAGERSSGPRRGGGGYRSDDDRGGRSGGRFGGRGSGGFGGGRDSGYGGSSRGSSSRSGGGDRDSRRDSRGGAGGGAQYGRGRTGGFSSGDYADDGAYFGQRSGGAGSSSNGRGRGGFNNPRDGNWAQW